MSAPITLTGRLGADPELSFAASGVAICKLRVVTDRRVKDGDEWKSVDTSWHYVTAFKELAEGVAEEMQKGDLVIVVGVLKQREYETREGEKRSTWEVTANHVGRDLSRPRKSAGAKPVNQSDPWATAAAQPQLTDSADPPF